MCDLDRPHENQVARVGVHERLRPHLLGVHLGLEFADRAEVFRVL